MSGFAWLLKADPADAARILASVQSRLQRLLAQSDPEAYAYRSMIHQQLASIESVRARMQVRLL